jgi:hypothetical protein
MGRFLPVWDFREEHGRFVDATPSQVRAALVSITPRELPLSGAMLALRLAPTILARRQWPRGLGRPWTELLVEFGFVELANEDDELVFGAVGQFWRLREELLPVPDAEAFVRFDEPHFAKAVINFRIVPKGGATHITTETRVRATDARARRLFRPYWVPVRAVGGLMRREMLRAIDRRAQRSRVTGPG